MSFKLTTAECRTRDDLQGELSKAWSDIEEAEQAFNKAMVAAKVNVENALGRFNQVAEHAQAFAEAIAERAQEEINARSVTWLESESGEAASFWRDEWKCFSIDDVDPDWPEYLDLDEPDFNLIDLPEEATCAS
jgi:hypothetical protein